MKTAVVILNYNTRDYLKQFLPYLLASCEGLDAHGNMTHLRSREEAGRAGSPRASWGLGEAERPQVPDGAGSWRPR